MTHGSCEVLEKRSIQVWPAASVRMEMNWMQVQPDEADVEQECFVLVIQLFAAS
jgi:hypothetical protein